MRPTRLALATLSLAAPALADTIEFSWARYGQSYSAFYGSANPAIGRTVISTHVLLMVRVDSGDAASFFTDIAFPIDPAAGNDNFLVVHGSDAGWSGVGTFILDYTTERFNGTVRVARFGAETPGEGWVGEILAGSSIVMTLFTEGCDIDFNGDGFIDFFDVQAFIACFEGAECPAGRTADFNGDGFVDYFDFDLYVLGFETGC